MKYSFLSFLLLFCFALGTAQVNYEAAYYINNSGETVTGFIKNEGWKNNPSQIEFKKSNAAEGELLKIDAVSEFGIENKLKYIRAKVAIDRSTDDDNYLTSIKAPKLEEENLFLKVLIEGDATLYVYEDNNLLRFFYNTETVPVEQLIYKRYKAYPTVIGKNEQYKQQLYNNLKCETINIGMANKLEYDQSELVRYFKTYNKCRNAIIADYELAEPKGDFNLTVRPSIRSASFSFNNAVANKKNATFDTKTSFNFGLEFEYVIPYKRNKWALILEPTYQSYKPSPEITEGGQGVEVNYSSIEVPFGLRHYFFLNDKSKLFANASFVIDLVLDSKFAIEYGDDLDITSGNSLALGAGYKYNNKYSVEVRYQTDRTLLADYNAYTSKYNSFSLLLGYTLF
ncbi:MAG: outer membrane beta-barrel protein [Aequorivita antarctica]